MAEPFELVGLRDFRSDLRKLDSRLPKYVSKAHRQIAKEIALQGRSAMQSSPFPALRRHAAKGIKWSGKATEASVVLKANTGAIAHERGTKVHHVFGKTVQASSMKRRVFPAWLGSKWDAGATGSFGKGGHVVAPIVERNLPRIKEEYLDYIEDALAQAFPD